MKRMIQLFTTGLFLLIGIVAVSACVPRAGGDPEDLIIAKETSYRVRPGDILNVRIWGEPQLSGDVVVREDGQLTLQLINDIPASGKTLQQLSTDVEKRLSKFIPGASVAISITQSAPIRYYLLGKFNRPGEMRSLGKITLLQAIATGGSFLPFANTSRVTLIRTTPEGEKRFGFNYDRVLDGSEPNPELLDGDTISVQ